MINLVIDLGNTRLKFGVYEKNILRSNWAGDIELAKDKLEDYLKEYPINHITICATGNSKDFVTFIEKKGLSYELITSDTPMPFTNGYKTPQTLGIDRMVLVAGSQFLFPKENVLVIDAGTCITYDFKDCKEVYQGGSISPGLQMRYKAMHEFTAKLPHLKAIEAEAAVIGKDTEGAMHSGVINGITQEIDGLIDWYKSEFEDLKIILTGGDGQFLSGRLKNGIFANSNFLLEGLNYITVFNKS